MCSVRPVHSLTSKTDRYEKRLTPTHTVTGTTAMVWTLVEPGVASKYFSEHTLLQENV
jgi:hypothetical protein